MENWKTYLQICREKKNYIKIAVIILIVITALVFFGKNGEKEDIPVTLDGTQTEQEIEVEEDAVSTPPETAKIVVDISGSVKNPGVYEVEEGYRLYEVIELAGGLLKNADTQSINQAEILTDGQKILIPEKGKNGEASGGSGLSSAITSDGKVNINIADSTELQEIPGVGPVTAEKIIAYREGNGRFATIEDIKNVDGIGEKTFEKIKDMITV